MQEMNEVSHESIPEEVSQPPLLPGLDEAIKKSQDYHFSTQYPEGYWVEELEGNPTITAEIIFFFHFMGIEDPERVEKIANYLLKYQREDGSWALFFDGSGDLSTSIEAYMALKMAGISPERDEMKRARKFIMENGGIRGCRVFTKIFMAMLGHCSWDPVPSMPVEIMLTPNWFYFNIHEMSSWSRGTVVPLLVIYAFKPVYPVPEGLGIKELFTGADCDLSVKSKKPGLNWPNTFLLLDKFLKLLEKLPWNPFRKFALKRAIKWILKHQEPEGDFGGIQPPMINSPVALKLMGYSMDHPSITKGLEAIDRFIIDRGDHIVMQACVSPLWDTAIASNALMDSGIPGDHPNLVKAGEWMLKKQLTKKGDWSIKNPHTPPGGWSFEFHNEAFPDTDDTAEILMALNRIEFADKEWKDKECKRGLTWLYGMQSSNGGWGAFDIDCDHALFNQIPFADHGAMLDPPTADVTGRILWMSGRLGISREHPVVQRAANFLINEQEPDGCWFGRWGVNYIYGTFLALSGLRSIGESADQTYIRMAGEWLKSCQNEDGGWGETCDSYLKPELRGQGVSTASQTAWAVMGLIESGAAESESARIGVEYLINRQNEDGSWYEDQFTGTGFPGYFFIKYHMYQQFFPLMAISRYRTAFEENSIGNGK